MGINPSKFLFEISLFSCLQRREEQLRCQKILQKVPDIGLRDHTGFGEELATYPWDDHEEAVCPLRAVLLQGGIQEAGSQEMSSSGLHYPELDQEQDW